VTPRAWTMHSRIQLVVTYKHTRNNYGKPLAKSLGSKESWKCSNTMFDGPSIKRWNNWINDELKQSKEKYKSSSIIKKITHGGEKSKRWKTCNVLTIFNDVEVGAKGTNILITQIYILLRIKIKFQPRWKKGASRKGGSTLEEG
jgi:hypothetical protein